jgi:hypothetical protein
MSTAVPGALAISSPIMAFGFHIHNLSGMATANILAALDAGVQWSRARSAASAGIAMPTRLGSVGNFPTEDLVAMLAEMESNWHRPWKDSGAVPRSGLLGIDPRSHPPTAPRGSQSPNSPPQVLMRYSTTNREDRSLPCRPRRRVSSRGRAGPADAVFIDLEDAVAPPLKVKARADAIAALNRWIGASASPFASMACCARGCATSLTLPRPVRGWIILLPKCETPGDVHAVEVAIDSAEQSAPRERAVGIMGLIESCAGVANVEAIAQSGGRLGAVVHGGATMGSTPREFPAVGRRASSDYVVLTDDDGRGCGNGTGTIPGISRRRGSLMRAGPLVLSDRRPVLGHSGFGRLRAPRRRRAALGFEGKMAIHASQIENDP